MLCLLVILNNKKWNWTIYHLSPGTKDPPNHEKLIQQNIVTRGNSDHGVIRTIGHVVYYCMQWSELLRVSRQTKEGRTRFLHVYEFSKLALGALHRIRFWLQSKFDLKRCDEVEKGSRFLGGSLMPLSFEWYWCNFFQLLFPSYSLFVRLSSFSCSQFFPKGTEYTLYLFLYLCLG